MIAADAAALNMKSPHEKGGKRWVNPYWRSQDLALAAVDDYLQLIPAAQGGLRDA